MDLNIFEELNVLIKGVLKPSLDIESGQEHQRKCRSGLASNNLIDIGPRGAAKHLSYDSTASLIQSWCSERSHISSQLEHSPTRPRSHDIPEL